jgi:circadian clock protein KaiB
MCELHLTGDYELSVVDLSADSGGIDRVVAAPTLIRTLPLPERQLVGDLSDTRKVLATLELESG